MSSRGKGFALSDYIASEIFRIDNRMFIYGALAGLSSFLMIICGLMMLEGISGSSAMFFRTLLFTIITFVFANLSRKIDGIEKLSIKKSDWILMFVIVAALYFYKVVYLGKKAYLFGYVINALEIFLFMREILFSYVYMWIIYFKGKTTVYHLEDFKIVKESDSLPYIVVLKKENRKYALSEAVLERLGDEFQKCEFSGYIKVKSMFWCSRTVVTDIW